MRIVCRSCVVAAALALPCDYAQAGVGDADPGFGSGGITIIDFTPIAGAPGNTTAASTAVDAQGRTWVAAGVSGSGAAGIGLARLTRSGQLDTSFGTGGRVFVPASAGSVLSLIGLRIGLGLTYVAYAETNAGPLLWHVCLIGESGGFDNGFFGSGCAGAAPPAGAVAHDLLVSPVNGNPWVLGSVLYPFTNRYLPTVAEFDLNTSTPRTASFPPDDTSIGIDAIAGTIDANGVLYFTGTYTPASGNADAVLGAIFDNGAVITSTLLASVAFDVNVGGQGSSLADVGRCIVKNPDGSVVIGVSVESGANGIYWGGAKFVPLISGYALDGGYGSGGKTAELIAYPGFGHASDDYAINACSQGRDGGLDMVGSYTFTDPTLTLSTKALTMYRLLGSGVTDMNFGGPFALPGTFYTNTYAGAVWDYLRPLAEPRLRDDSASSVSSLPHTDSIIVGAVSRRTDGTVNGDPAVMRVLGDDIFNDGFP